jgi:hypothetical protein
MRGAKSKKKITGDNPIFFIGGNQNKPTLQGDKSLFPLFLILII